GMIEIPALGFLRGECQARFQDYSPITDVTLLAGPQLDAAIEQLRVLLAFMASEPLRIAEVCDGDTDHFGQALTTNHVPPGPKMDANDVTGDDEGTGDECIVAHVQGVLALLENARRHGLAALHIYLHL
ncbi:MAG TPA: hypothetical protein VF348_04035, partial [Usitatibacter sp.]